MLKIAPQAETETLGNTGRFVRQYQILLQLIKNPDKQQKTNKKRLWLKQDRSWFLYIKKARDKQFKTGVIVLDLSSS